MPTEPLSFTDNERHTLECSCRCAARRYAELADSLKGVNEPLRQVFLEQERNAISLAEKIAEA